MKRILLLSFVLLTLISFGAIAQRTVSGKITDDTGEALPGVNVLIKGTTTGTQTDLDGNYRLSVSQGATLIFSFVGFNTQEIEIGSRTIIDLSMGGATELQEVIVAGYGSQVKETSNISSSTVSSETIENRPNASLVQRLQGQIPGLNITTGSGQPGGGSTVLLRGVSSINGDIEPLFVIDGSPVDQDNFRSLNPNDIADITVLKDAGATAIYGNRGANGVILITTRRAEYGQPLRINYTYLGGVSNLQDQDYNLMSSQEQLRLERAYGQGLGAERLSSDGFNATNNYPTFIDPSRPDNTRLTDAEIANAPNTDWLDYFFRDAVYHNHNLSVSGGGERNSFFMNFGYLNQEGVLEASSLERYNFRINTNGKSNDEKFTYGINLSLNTSSNNEPNTIGSGAINRNLVLGALQSVPYISPEDYINGEELVSPLLFRNTPLFLIDRLKTYSRLEDEVKIIGSINLNYEIIEGLQLGYILGGDFEDEVLTRAEGPTSFNAFLFAQVGNATPGFQSQQNTKQFTQNQVLSLNYTKSFGEHTLGMGLFSELFEGRFKTFGYFAEGLTPATFYPGDGSSFVADNAANDFFTDNGNANLLNVALFSYFGRLSYDYASRFGGEFVLRRDLSSRFPEDNRNATFYSVSARWNLHNESFLQGSSILNTLKLRGSYGINGNQVVQGSGTFTAPDLYLDLYGTGQGYEGRNSIFLNQLGVNTLTWETSAQLNIGVDAELFNNALVATVDVYQKRTKDLFQLRPVSAITSVTGVSANIGELENRGIDWLVSYNILRSSSIDRPNLRFQIVGNYNIQKIIDLPVTEKDENTGELQILGIGRVGGKLNEYFTLRYAGVNPANGNLLFLTKDGELTENPNVDTDRVWLNKNIWPDINGGINIDLDWKNFFASVQFNYTIGTDRFDGDLAGFQDPTSLGQFRSSRDLARAWTPTNTNTDIPSLTASNLNLAGNRYLASSDFLRLRFAQIGYTIPSSLLSKVNVRENQTFSNARVFVNGENLITFTKWRGLDAEALNNGLRLYPTPRVVSVGIELGF